MRVLQELGKVTAPEAPAPIWLKRVDLENRGALAPVYPSGGLREIRELADARPVLLEATEALESEFGRELIEPIYRLVWALNAGSHVFTSHAAVGQYGITPCAGYEWAAHSLGIAVTILPRSGTEQKQLRIAERMADELTGLIIASPFRSGDVTGWLTLIRPECVRVGSDPLRSSEDTEDALDLQIGYGCELNLCGYAETRKRAAERLRSLAEFLASTLGHKQIKRAITAKAYPPLQS